MRGLIMPSTLMKSSLPCCQLIRIINSLSDYVLEEAGEIGPGKIKLVMSEIMLSHISKL